MKIIGIIMAVALAVVVYGNGCANSDQMGVLTGAVQLGNHLSNNPSINDPNAANISLKSSAMTAELGFAYRIEIATGTPSDDMNNANISTLKLFEDGVELGEAHALHADIRSVGKGKFSHWRGNLIFSASDNSNPALNGRTYSYRVEGNQQASPLTLASYKSDLYGGENIVFDVSGGVAPYSFAMLNGGGTVDKAGSYTAPNFSSRPTIRISDSKGQIVDAKVKSAVLHYIGGNLGGVSQNNVWSSHDGASWVSQKSLPISVQGFSLGVLNDIIYLIGGWTTVSSAATYSVAAIDASTMWSQGPNFPAAAEMAGRTVVNNKMYVAFKDKFYSTSDGLNFNVESFLPGYPDNFSGSQLTYFNGKFWLVGGLNSSTGEFARHVWNSADGKTWAFVAYIPGARYAGALYAFNNKMYFAGGFTGGATAGDVYSTSDGLTWTQIGSLPAARDQIRGVVYKNKMWVIGGSLNNVAQATVYSSVDGITWNTVGNLPAPRFSGDVVIY